MNIAGHFRDDTRKALRSVWSWLRRMGQRAMVGTMPDAASKIAAAVSPRPHEAGTVLPFPIRGEALLVKLAEQLRRRIDELAPMSEQLSLTLSHQPHLRLALDGDAYVTFDAATSEFELVIEAPGGTRLILQTVEFDAVVKFVLQYVVERLADHAPLEVAS